MQLTFQEELKSVAQPVDKNLWITSPTTINAFYYYPGNSLTIPAGILQIPFFNEKLPDALNYGAIGSFIGHEISHGFDDVGSQYDENGNVRDWWSNNIKAEYNKRALCFEKKFSEYVITAEHQTYKLDSIQTLSENIADTTGINALYKAFTIHSMKYSAQANVKLPGLEHLNSRKLLFLAWAHSFCTRPKLTDLLKTLKSDTHSPASFRIIGTLSNTNAFSDTYQCAKGTPMNPADPINKCGIW
ncbi:hypothetical protein PV327_002374 [Microctonus hyperodae]|uniref:Peptidase M13 C-terminal domain-containing protein n=1 Tax=Microctonus hyperodae TaxID=165561 RepID=A0AA39FFF9_MICHY|nr:hypothetical protein PV327_002374 [Microctonus hyperodae]